MNILYIRAWGGLILLLAFASIASAQPPVRIREGTGAPSSTLCQASTDRGGVYLRYDNPATNPSQAYFCGQTGPAAYAWQFISHKVGASAPAICDVGEVFFNSAATAGQNWYGCTAANTWTPLGNDPTPFALKANVQSGSYLYCRSTTGNDTYTCLLTPTLTAYTRGSCLQLDADTANTGAATLNVDSLGAKSILHPDGSTLNNSDITANHPLVLCYDGTEYLLQGVSSINGLTSTKIPKATSSTTIADSNLSENADGSDNAAKALTWASASAPTFNAGGTTTCDFSASNLCGFTMTGNTALAFTNPHGGGPYILKVTMDATGGRVITYPGSVSVAPQPDTAANVVSHIVCFYDGSTNYYCFSGGSNNSTPSFCVPGSTSGQTCVQSAATASGTLTLPAATDTLTGKATTDTLTNKTLDTAGAGNSFKINGTSITAVEGNTAKVALFSGSDPATNDCAKFDANHNIVGNGSGCGGGAGGSIDFSGNTSAITQTGSDVTIYTTASVPALAAGKCYLISFAIGGSVAHDDKIFVDSSLVVTPATGDNNLYFTSQFSYCNDSGVQNAQHVTYAIGGYDAAGGGGGGITLFWSPTKNSAATNNIDWSTSHTITLKTNGASGTVTGFYWRISN